MLFAQPWLAGGQGRPGTSASMNAPVPKSMITRAVVAGEGHGCGDAVGLPQDANENVPLAMNTQTHESGEIWLERETSP